MNISSVLPDRIAVAPLLAELEACEPGCYVALEPQSPGYIEPLDVWLRPQSDFDEHEADEIRAGIGTRHNGRSFVQLYRIETGERVQFSDLPDGFFDNHPNRADLHRSWYLPNAVSRLGDELILIGVGYFEVYGESVVDGEPAFEFISIAEAVRREQLERDKFLPLVTKSLPTWADPNAVEVFDAHADCDRVTASFQSHEFVPEQCGWPGASLRIDAWAEFNLKGELLNTLEPTTRVYLPELRDAEARASSDDLRMIAAGLVALADEFDRITAGQS